MVVSGQEAEGEVTQVLVKFNGMPREVPQLDSLVELQGCELRDAWRNATGAIPEGQVIAGLSSRELALNLLQGKRKREAPQCLVHWQIDRWGIYFGKWVCEFSEGFLGLRTGVWEDLRVKGPDYVCECKGVVCPSACYAYLGFCLIPCRAVAEVNPPNLGGPPRRIDIPQGDF